MKRLTPDNTELWISNWKRKDVIGSFVREWLDSFDFRRVNLITNHSSVTIDDIPSDIRDMVKVWNNELRHDSSIGPMVKNYNQAYVHTFLSGKEFCICAHDNMHITKGWDDVVNRTEYDLYMAPQGDQVHIMSLDGLRRYGWWDERYATNGNHELDFIVRALRRDMLTGEQKSSIFDIHPWRGWPTGGPILNAPNPVQAGTLHHNICGLEMYFERADKQAVPQTGPKTPHFAELKWNYEKWGGDPQIYSNFMRGPLYGEIDWYPWLDLNSLTTDVCAIN